MQVNRDQLHAHQFMVGRLTLALLREAPDQPERPMRRTAMGGFVGLLGAIVLLVGFGVYGLSGRGASNRWKGDNTIIVEKETGTRYLYLDGTLRPVVNYTSARLAAGGAKAKVEMVSQSSLKGTPHGRAIGIAGAPDNLPATDRLLTSPWLVCNTSTSTDGADPTLTTAVLLGAGPPVDEQPVDTGALVADRKGTNYLIWHGQRMRIRTAGALQALGYGSTQPVAVAPAWLNALTAGPDVAAPQVPQRGGQGPRLGDRKTRVGQVVQASIGGGAAGYSLVLKDGLRPISQTVARLLLFDPDTADAYPDATVAAIPVNPADVAAARRSTLALPDLPPVSPTLVTGVDGTRSLCVRLSFDANRGPTATLALTRQPVPVGNATSGGTNQVLVASGRGLLVTAQASPGVNTGTVYVVTDLGVKYPMATADVVTALGFGGATATPVPTTILGLLPTGPALDAEAARRETWTAR